MDNRITVDDLLGSYEEWNPDVGGLSYTQHIIAATTAGIAEHVMLYPFDTIRTRAQSFVFSRLSLPSISSMILSESGILGFWRGSATIALGCIPSHIALFSVYETLKDRLKVNESEGLRHHAAVSFCAASSTFAHDAIITPVDVVKQRMQLGSYSSAYECVTQCLKNEGLTGLYRSLPVTFLLNAPFTAVLVMTSNSLQNLLFSKTPEQIIFKRNDENEPYKISQNGIYDKTVLSTVGPKFFTSSVGSVIATIITQPLDLIRTRLQTQVVGYKMPNTESTTTSNEKLNSTSNTQAYSLKDPKYKKFSSTLKIVLKEEGARGLFRGLLPRLSVVAPGGALCWGTYESVREYFLVVNQ